ncbi:hypothetical protein HZF05_20625 [Sphingomonas sp. CGMCC 1.13654]|uniref:Uncharacterized protein n=1 Tax=Sphingomonas chungangi TaxID=2683589 RepID=A0A838LAQ7_9SPHN|nr:hypothetical protein [Sphingomonas chungangi]MBA2936493.1 hypothetical protein [Sphingomonas chungangi]MVW55878.1 hypothetical protein [Sphingomonas chungangi]
MRYVMFACSAVAVLSAMPATAAYHLMTSGTPEYVAKSGLSVTPSQDWNRLGSRPGRNAESWTLDGLALNDMTFYGGIGNDETLFRDAQKKDMPLPHFSSTMLAPDVAQLFEGSYRVANNTTLMSVDSIEPAQVGDQKGFRFTYSFTKQDEEVKRKGEALGAIVGGKLYLLTFEAPAIFYFDRDIASARALMTSAKIGPAPKSN